MPTLIRLFLVLVFLAGLGFAGMIALTAMAGTAAQSCRRDEAKREVATSNHEATPPPTSVSPEGDVIGWGLSPDVPRDAPACDQGACASGYLCCVPCCVNGRAPVCLKAVDGGCPLPDLSVNEAALSTKISLEYLEAGQCELEENCVAGPGRRN